MTYKNVKLDSEILHQAEMKVKEYEDYLNSKFKQEPPEFPDEELHLVQFASNIRLEIHQAALNLFHEVNSQLRDIEHKMWSLSEEEPYDNSKKNILSHLDALAREIHQLREFFGSTWLDCTPSVPEIEPPSPNNEFTERMRKAIEKINKEQQ